MTSLVVTVLNEGRTIGKLLASLSVQTKKPDEVIFVDGGSKDKTVKKMENGKWKMKKDNIGFKIFVKPGFSIAKARNFGIKKTEGEIIVMTDAGCVPHNDWFEKITQPFTDPTIDIVAGFYKMTGDSVFQKCLACYLGVLPERLNPKTFLPSARSIAFKKEIWQKVGGFSEKLERAGEDTLFNYQAKRLGAKFITVPDALVNWEIPKTPGETFKKFYTYATGDIEALYWPHLKKIFLVYFRYLVGVLLFILSFYNIYFLLPTFSFLLLYFSWAVWKNYRYVNNPLAFFYLPMLQLTADLAVMVGTVRGLLRRIR